MESSAARSLRRARSERTRTRPEARHRPGLRSGTETPQPPPRSGAAAASKRIAACPLRAQVEWRRGRRDPLLPHLKRVRHAGRESRGRAKREARDRRDGHARRARTVRRLRRRQARVVETRAGSLPRGRGDRHAPEHGAIADDSAALSRRGPCPSPSCPCRDPAQPARRTARWSRSGPPTADAARRSPTGAPGSARSERGAT